MKPKKYRSRPTYVEAMQWPKEHNQEREEIIRWVERNGGKCVVTESGALRLLNDLLDMYIHDGNYIVKDQRSRFIAYDKKEFERRFEQVFG